MSEHCSRFFAWYVAIFEAALIIAPPAIMPSEAAPACLPDDSLVQVRGKIKEVASRDRITGKPYSYFIIDADRSHCVTGPDVDERSSTPAYDITLAPPESLNERQAFGDYIGRRVQITGTISSSNGGGSLLFAKAVKPLPSDK
jgi:hypothetical protein